MIGERRASNPRIKPPRANGSAFFRIPEMAGVAAPLRPLIVNAAGGAVLKHEVVQLLIHDRVAIPQASDTVERSLTPEAWAWRWRGFPPVDASCPFNWAQHPRSAPVCASFSWMR